MNNNTFLLLTLVLVVTVIGLSIAWADNGIVAFYVNDFPATGQDCHMNAQEYGYVYEVVPDKFDYLERLDRMMLYADAFGLSGTAADVSEIRERGSAFGGFLGNNRWTYGYHEASGQEIFADLTLFTMSFPEEGCDLIDEKLAAEVSLDAIAYLFADSTRVEIRSVHVSRIWDYAQLTPDEVAGEIQKTSNETVVKVFRAKETFNLERDPSVRLARRLISRRSHAWLLSVATGGASEQHEKNLGFREFQNASGR